MLNRQVALINDQLDVFDALAETEETVEAPAEEPTTDPATGDLVLFALPAAPAPAAVAEQLAIDLVA